MHGWGMTYDIEGWDTYVYYMHIILFYKAKLHELYITYYMILHTTLHALTCFLF
jgi:hypothetical protein